PDIEALVRQFPAAEARIRDLAPTVEGRETHRSGPGSGSEFRVRPELHRNSGLTLNSRNGDPILAGRVALVTGSSRGIGLAIARRFAMAGAAVMTNARNPPTNEDAAGDVDAERFAYHCADVGTVDGAESLVAATLARFGRLDVVINNAGVQPSGAWI